MSELKSCPFCGQKPRIESGFNSEGKPFFRVVHDCPNFVRTIKTLCRTTQERAESEWNRRAEPENDPLTLEDGFEITNADGSPIDYDVLGKKYKDQLCYCDIDGFYISEDGQLVLMDDCGKSVPADRGDYHITVRGPVSK